MENTTKYYIHRENEFYGDRYIAIFNIVPTSGTVLCRGMKMQPDGFGGYICTSITKYNKSVYDICKQMKRHPDNFIAISKEEYESILNKINSCQENILDTEKYINEFVKLSTRN